MKRLLLFAAGAAMCVMLAGCVSAGNVAANIGNANPQLQDALAKSCTAADAALTLPSVINAPPGTTTAVKADDLSAKVDRFCYKASVVTTAATSIAQLISQAIAVLQTTVPPS